mgnify:CR=1 FL=1
MSGSLIGKVLDTEGNPIEDVTVTVVDADTGDTTATVATNASGEYSSGTIPDGTYDVTANERGYIPDTQTDQSVSGGTTSVPDHTIQAAGYKIRGEVTDFGYGVVGIASGTEGDPVGVRGTVPNTDTGYGFSTPDDARVDGEIEATSGHTLTVSGDPTFRLLPQTDNFGILGLTIGGGVVAGYENNSVNGTVGSAVLGGGASGDETVNGQPRDNTNEVTGDLGVICGGINNRSGESAFVGGGGGNTAGGNASVVVGGRENIASGEESTVGGGDENTASGEESTVGGGDGNTASGTEATVSGGNVNTASGDESTVGGGFDNTASAGQATVGGGDGNTADGIQATVGGGYDNTANANEATVGGGGRNLVLGENATVAGGGGFSDGNEAHGEGSTVGGGQNNRTGKSGQTTGQAATVPGGEQNVAEFDYTFAAGRQAEARNEGAFVWGDSSTNTANSTNADQVVFQADGGVTLYSASDLSSKVELNPGDGSWTQGSSRAIKSTIEPVDPGQVLSGVEDLEVSTWEYDANAGVTHMGPMAEEFADQFDLGDDETMISTVDADGVAFAAIQGLCERLEAKDERIDELEARLAKLEEQVGTAPPADG